MVDFYEGMLDFFSSIGEFINNMLSTIQSFFTLIPRIVSRAVTLGGLLPPFVTAGVFVVIGICLVKIILDLL